MLKRKEPSGPYISRMAAQYPFAMNAQLALRLGIMAGMERQKRIIDANKLDHFSAAGRWSNSLVRSSLLLSSQSGIPTQSGSSQDLRSGSSSGIIGTSGSPITDSGLPRVLKFASS